MSVLCACMCMEVSGPAAGLSTIGTMHLGCQQLKLVRVHNPVCDC